MRPQTPPTQASAAPRWSESIRSPWWIWLAAALMSLSLGAAYGAAYGAVAGWLVGLGLAGLLAAALAARTLRIVVTDTDLQVGRARLPGTAIGRVVALDQQQFRAAHTTRSDARAWYALRPQASAAGVIVEVADAADPHPYWLVSSRDPAGLARAVATIGRSG